MLSLFLRRLVGTLCLAIFCAGSAGAQGGHYSERTGSCTGIALDEITILSGDDGAQEEYMLRLLGFVLNDPPITSVVELHRQCPMGADPRVEFHQCTWFGVKIAPLLEAVISRESMPIIEEWLSKQFWVPQKGVYRDWWYTFDGWKVLHGLTSAWWKLSAKGLRPEEQAKLACSSFEGRGYVLHPGFCLKKIRELGRAARGAIYDVLEDPDRGFRGSGVDVAICGGLQSLIGTPEFAPSATEVGRILGESGLLPRVVLTSHLIEVGDASGIEPAMDILENGNSRIAVTMIIDAIGHQKLCVDPDSPFLQLAEKLLGTAIGGFRNPDLASHDAWELRQAVFSEFSMTWTSELRGYGPALNYFEKFLEGIDPDNPLAEVEGHSALAKYSFSQMIVSARAALEMFRGVKFDWTFVPLRVSDVSDD